MFQNIKLNPQTFSKPFAKPIEENKLRSLLNTMATWGAKHILLFYPETGCRKPESGTGSQDFKSLVDLKVLLLFN
jgi:hypothetical protein